MVSFDMSNLVTKFVVKYNVMGKYLTQEEVITRLTNTFGDKYDYSKVTYVTNRVNVCIVCPIHGEFYQTPHSHLSGNGCPKCLYKSQYKLYSRLCKANNCKLYVLRYDYKNDDLQEIINTIQSLN